MTETIASGLPAFPMARTNPFDPPPEYGELREKGPSALAVMPSGEKIWLILSHAHARQILTDSRVTACRSDPGFPVVLGMPNRELMYEMSKKLPALLGMDPPEHSEHRRIAIPEFTVKRVNAMRSRITDIVNQCVDDLLAAPRPADFVQAISVPVPTLVICDLLGVPYADRSEFSKHTGTLVKRNSNEDEKRTAVTSLMSYLEELVVQNEQEPGDHVIGRMIARYQATGHYSRKHMVGMAVLLLNGGQETTANMISLGIVTLLAHPEYLAQIKQDPTLTPRAVEELLRYFSVATENTGYRAATADIEIGNVVIRKGDGILVVGSAANRDSEAFSEPDKFDIHRDCRHHLAFGYGAHQCLGQHLTRLEMEVAFNTVFTRIPEIHMAIPEEQIKFKYDASPYGVYELPVTW
jgi:cytochrome P450